MQKLYKMAENFVLRLSFNRFNSTAKACSPTLQSVREILNGSNCCTSLGGLNQASIHAMELIDSQMRSSMYLFSYLLIYLLSYLCFQSDNAIQHTSPSTVWKTSPFITYHYFTRSFFFIDGGISCRTFKKVVQNKLHDLTGVTDRFWKIDDKQVLIPW